MEKWKKVTRINPLYEVSNYGRVRSWKNNKWGKRDNPKILKQQGVGFEYKDENHYFGVSLDGIKRRVHRLVAIAFIPNPDNKPYINHIDGIKHNNHVDNLEWCTHAENYVHATENGLMKKGEEHGMSKLTNTQVIEIRDIAKERGYFYNAEELSDRYNVSLGTIKRVVGGDTWGHV